MNYLSMQTLSIVTPNGIRIANGQKTLEIRRWKPIKPIMDLLIIENQLHLNNTLTEEPGIAVCIVDVINFHDWVESELKEACGKYWEPGWIAWELTNVRKITPFPALAKRNIYETIIDARLTITCDNGE